MRWPLRRVGVQGPSMAPTLRSGDQLLVWLGPVRRPRPGRIVLVALPQRPLSVKRLVAVTAGGVRVEGDSPLASTDSRQLGLLPSSALVGSVLARLWPRPALLTGAADRPGAGRARGVPPTG